MPAESTESIVELDPPRFENCPPRIIAGLRGRFTAETRTDIPQQWERFAPQMDDAPARVGRAAYGVCFILSGDAGFDYLCGVEVSDDLHLPAGWVSVRIPAQRYAVFPHRGDLSTLPKALDAIWHQWVPKSGCELAGAVDSDLPAFLERYGEEFDPQTRSGGIEVWIPIKA